MKIYFPYPQLKTAPVLTLRDATVDGVRPVPYPVEDHLQTVEFGRVGEPETWETAGLRLRVETPADVAAAHTDLQVVAIASCPATNLRWSSLLEVAEPGVFEGDLALPRSQCRGRVDVYAEVVATVDGVRFRRVGETPQWHVRFDAAEPLAIHGALEVRWAHFSPPEGEESPVPSEAAGESFYVELAESDPVVYLNLSLDGFHALLSDATGRPPLEEQLRESELRRIAAAAWTSLFNVALSSIHKEDDDAEVEWPEVEWKTRVLKTFLPRAYPAQDAIEALAQAHTDLAQGDPTLQTRVQLAVSRLLDSGKALEKGLKAIERNAG